MSDESIVRFLRKLRNFGPIGVLLGLLSGVFSATAGFIVKLIPDIHPVEIVVWRSLMRLTVYLAVIIGGRMSLKGEPGERKYLFFRAVVGFFATTTSYWSFRFIPFADASTIIFASPVFVSIFARVFLKEDCGFLQIFNIFITIVGIVLIARPTFIFGEVVKNDIGTSEQMAGISLALCASFCFALCYVIMRKLKKTPSEVIIFWFACTSIAFGLMGVAVLELSTDYVPGVPQTPAEISLIFVNGLLGVISQPLLTIALKIEQAGVISLTRTIDVVLGFVYQAAFLDEPVAFTSVVGATIVTFSVILTILRKWRNDNPKSFARCCSSDSDEAPVQQPIVAYQGLKEQYT